ncbi:MAG: hypothetical protein EB039_12550 [Proteobacteria bacterium]|nr:hypothetical protein [Pseudomonadota bacterium]
MRASAPVVVSVGGAMPASLPSMRNPDAVAPVAPREPLAPVPPTTSGAVAPSIPAPLPPLGSTASVPAIERTSAVVATNAVAASSAVTQPAAAADGSASKVTISTNPSSAPKSAPATSSGTPAARALNTYDQSWTTYTGTLRRAARALLDEAARRHARALAIWATVVPQA